MPNPFSTFTPEFVGTKTRAKASASKSSRKMLRGRHSAHSSWCGLNTGLLNFQTCFRTRAELQIQICRSFLQRGHHFIHRGLDHLGLETVRGTWVISSALSPGSVYSHIVSFHRNWPSMKGHAIWHRLKWSSAHKVIMVIIPNKRMSVVDMHHSS